MTHGGKIITGSIIGAGLIAGYSYLQRLKSMKDQLVVIPSASVAKMNLGGLTIRVDTVLKNPTRGSFTMKFPFIKLLYKGVVMGSSEVVNQDIKVPALGQAKIEKMMVELPMESIFSVAAALLKAIKNHEQVKLQIEVITEVNVGWIKKSYRRSHEVVLAT